MLGLQHLIRLPALGVALVSLSVSLTAYAAQQDIAALLDQHVIGQSQAKKVLSVAVHNHYKRILHTQQQATRASAACICGASCGCCCCMFL